MTISPLAFADSLRIGTIDFVSPSEIKVLLELNAPDAVALNASTPHPFPRLNGYVLIPSDGGYLVGQIEWITIERSAFPKRRGMQDFGLIDLPYPLRKLSLNPLGMLRSEVAKDGELIYQFRRGVDAFPSVGQPVLLPTRTQLQRIVESGANRRVRIGTSPLAADADVSVDPDRLFGRHLAVLGNTGSGKSCSVAGLIRWSLEAAENARYNNDAEGPNARFIVLDPNGEYGNAFDGLADTVDIKRFSVDASEDVEQLQVPLWFWNSEEWCAFTKAAPKAQRPVLVQALRAVRDGALATNHRPSSHMRRFLRTLVTITRLEQSNGTPWGTFPKPMSFFNKIELWRNELTADSSVSAPQKAALDNLCLHLDHLLNARRVKHPTWDFSRTEITELIDFLSEAHSTFGGTDTDTLPINPDTPQPFTGDQLLRSIEANAELLNVVGHVETMLMRIRTLLADTRMKSIINTPEELSLDKWLAKYIGDDANQKASVTIIDLSLVPVEVVHIIAAVIARITLEAQQRYRKQNDGRVLPTVLVMEEAHTFIKRYKDDAENQNNAQVCCQVFEKIAREGRKFGLGLVLSSQRPSELSPTVLSQCNTFLLHRISNDRDQELVHKLVPDNLRGLLRDLPSLPARQAVLLGWASELPTLVEIRHLSKEDRPKSDDPDFWNVWTRKAERNVDWQDIAATWQDGNNAPTKPVESDDSWDDLEESSDPWSTTSFSDDEIPF